MTSDPRPSAGSGDRTTRPSATSRSTRALTVPGVSAISLASLRCDIPPGWLMRTSVTSMVNVGLVTLCSAKTASCSSAMMARSRPSRLMTPTDETSRSGRTWAHWCSTRSVASGTAGTGIAAAAGLRVITQS